LKFLSWSIALGSGTSGGTLAPLLTIGGASGVLAGEAILYIYPESGVTLSLAALVGMSAMFAGASRAVLTSIIFGLETTSQSNALLPLLAACTASYVISFLIMKNTIMTEKIARRGIKTPHSYESDILERVTVGQIMKPNSLILDGDRTIQEVQTSLSNVAKELDYFIVTSGGKFSGIVSSSRLFDSLQNLKSQLKTLARNAEVSISIDHSLRTATEIMTRENIYVLAIQSGKEKEIIGTVSYKEIIDAIHGGEEHLIKDGGISIKRHLMKIVIRGKRLTKME
jgi:CBS domain-containing protein